MNPQEDLREFEGGCGKITFWKMIDGIKINFSCGIRKELFGLCPDCQAKKKIQEKAKEVLR